MGAMGKNTLTQFDMCSGIGAGYPYAGTALGLKLVGTAEIDQYCSDILSKRYPGIKNYGDIRCIEEVEDEPDVVTISPPCQPFSLRGKRLGANDERDCFPAFFQFVAIARPKYCAVENVPGLLNCPHRPGERKLYINHIAEEFTRLGYKLEGVVISSASLGSPFIRKRLLLVAISNRLQFHEFPTGWDEQIRTLFKAEGIDKGNRGYQSQILRGKFRNTGGLDESVQHTNSIGILRGGSVARQRRAALGNSFDPRVAAIALARILYLNSLVVK